MVTTNKEKAHQIDQFVKFLRAEWLAGPYEVMTFRQFTRKFYGVSYGRLLKTQFRFEEEANSDEYLAKLEKEWEADSCK